MENRNETADILSHAKQKMAEDMKAREIGAIIWSIPDAGFHFIPEIVVTNPADGSSRTVRVTGLYVYKDTLYAIEEDTPQADIANFYRHGIDVKPTVVTLTPDMAAEQLPEPDASPCYTTEGTLEEWTVVADCYFEALAES